MMTGLLLAFTGWAVAITNQYDTPYCVAHAVATCGSLYGYTGDYSYYVDELNIGYYGYNINGLPRALNLNISYPQRYKYKSQIQALLNKGPLITDLPKWFKYGTRETTNGTHSTCAVGYNDVGIVIADSAGEKAHIKGYAVIPYSDLYKLRFQTLGKRSLSPKSIKIWTKSESSTDTSEDKSQSEKSPTTTKEASIATFVRVLRITSQWDR